MAYEQTDAVVDYYEEFALHREDSTQKILKDLKKVQRQWRTLGVRSGREGKEANEKLRLIEKALQVFQSDELRHTYDESLKQVPKAIKSEKKTDWINESWKYYFVGDNGPAKIAAAKARTAENDNPQCYVVSAWVELAEAWGSDREKRQTYRQAKKYADESYVLDLEKSTLPTSISPAESVSRQSDSTPMPSNASFVLSKKPTHLHFATLHGGRQYHTPYSKSTTRQSTSA